MIQAFVDRFLSGDGQAAMRAALSTHPDDYAALVKQVVTVVRGSDEYDSPDPERIHAIDDGDYQGTLVFVVAAGGYQPSTYWYVKVSYGSCSGCDTLQSIRSYDDTPPSEEQVKEYMTLALHIVQGLKLMGDES